MATRGHATRAAARLAGRRDGYAHAAGLGATVRQARRRRGWTQRELAARIGLTQARVAQLELGRGGGAPLEVWFAIGHALEMPFQATFARDRREEPADAGHLRIQELALRLARETGRRRTFELPSRPQDPAHSVDVCVVDERWRTLLLIECWNTFGSVNAAIRSTRRKIAEAEALAVSTGGEAGAFRVAAAWIIRDTRRNREIVSSYPEVFAAAFSASSTSWVRVLTRGDAPPPADLGLVWCDPNATRLFAWRVS